MHARQIPAGRQVTATFTSPRTGDAVSKTGIVIEGRYPDMYLHLDTDQGVLRIPWPSIESVKHGTVVLERSDEAVKCLIHGSYEHITHLGPTTVGLSCSCQMYSDDDGRQWFSNRRLQERR